MEAEDKQMLDEMYQRTKGLWDNYSGYYLPGDAGVALVQGAGVNTYGAFVSAVLSMVNDGYLIGIECSLDQIDDYTIEVAKGGDQDPIEEFKCACIAPNQHHEERCYPVYVELGAQVWIRIKTVGGGNDTISGINLKFRKRNPSIKIIR